MTDDLTIVTFGGGTSGTGFSLEVGEGHPKPGAAFVAAADRLRKSEVRQPDGLTGYSSDHPVWGLRHDVVDHAGYWCFTVQGMNERFGRAGSCQFLYLPDARPAHEVWRLGARMVDADGRLGHTPVGPGLGHAGPRHIRPVLDDLLADRAPLVIDGDPRHVATVIADVLSVLPGAEVRRRVWWTYPLQTPRLEQRVTVAGLPPAGVETGSVAQWLGRVTETADRDPIALEGPGLEWLTDTASGGHAEDPEHFPDRFRDLDSLADLVEAVVDNRLEPDIAALVSADDPRLKQHVSAVNEWTRSNPAEAIRKIMNTERRFWLPNWLFDILRQNQVGGGGNYLHCPPEPEPARGWHTRLATLLREDPERMSFVTEHLTAPGKPLADPADIRRHAGFFDTLGVPITDLAPIRAQERAKAGRGPRLTAVRGRSGKATTEAPAADTTGPAPTRGRVRLRDRVTPTPTRRDDTTNGADLAAAISEEIAGKGTVSNGKLDALARSNGYGSIIERVLRGLSGTVIPAAAAAALADRAPSPQTAGGVLLEARKHNAAADTGFTAGDWLIDVTRAVHPRHRPAAVDAVDRYHRDRGGVLPTTFVLAVLETCAVTEPYQGVPQVIARHAARLLGALPEDAVEGPPAGSRLRLPSLRLRPGRPLLGRRGDGHKKEPAPTEADGQEADHDRQRAAPPGRAGLGELLATHGTTIIWFVAVLFVVLVVLFIYDVYSRVTSVL